MPIDAIIGAQFGSEGKGKIAAYLSSEYLHAVRTGGPNAGHTVILRGSSLIFRHIPCAAINLSTRLYLAAGAIIDVKVLQEEMKFDLNISGRLMIDQQAAIISDSDPNNERSLKNLIGSTAKGVGSALIKKLSRDGSAILAKDVPELSKFIGPVADNLCEAAFRNETILLEGTQGTGLSIHHGIYPYVTSRDVTVGSLCGEAGVPPTSIRKVILAVRPYPIRVAGNSGPLSQEISWKIVKNRSGSTRSLVERTTVTGLVRRVGEFDLSSVKRAVKLNGATEIALTFADHLNAKAYACDKFSNLPNEVIEFVDMLEREVSVPISLISTGPANEHIVDRRANC